MMNSEQLRVHIWIIVLGFLFIGSTWAWSGTVTNQRTDTQYTDLQEAINSASSDDVLLLEGTFNGSFTINAPSLGITALTLQGTSDTEPAILDGQGANRVLVVLGPQTGEKPFILLSNLILQNGSITKENEDKLKLGPNGGAILNAFADLTLSSVTIQNNHADQLGGGIANIFSILRVENSIFTGNEANQGGAIGVLTTTTTISDTLIKENSAIDAGGAIVSNTSINTISNCIIINNQALFGGGIFNNYSVTTINTTKIHNNSAGEDGGGVYNYSNATALINSSSIKYNKAAVDVPGGKGSGIFNDFSYYFLEDTKVIKNTPKPNIYPPES